MYFRFKHFLFSSILLLLIAACNGHDDPVPTPSGSSRTVLVYVVADNSLSSFASDDINEMIAGMKQIDESLCNLLVYVDDKSTPVLYRLTKDKKGVVTKEVVKSYSEQDSTDPAVMKGIVNQAFRKYPADSYGLVYWSHGEGWLPVFQTRTDVSTRWVGQDIDDGYGTTHYMNISELASVLSATPHLDFLLFDACFMFSVEVAYELRDYTNYVIASPTEIPGPGASYDYLVPAMLSTEKSGDERAKYIASAYYDPYAATYNPSVDNTDDNWTSGVSVGVLKTSELDNLANATKSILPSSMDNIAVAASIPNYDRRSSSSYSFVGYYDFLGLAKQLSDGNSAFTTWKSAFDRAVIYWKTTPINYSAFAGNFSMEGSSGLSHYIPLTLNSTTATAYRTCAWYTAAGWDKIGW